MQKFVPTNIGKCINKLSVDKILGSRILLNFKEIYHFFYLRVKIISF